MALVMQIKDQDVLRIGEDVLIRFYKDSRGGMKVAICAPKDVSVKREKVPTQMAAAKEGT